MRLTIPQHYIPGGTPDIPAATIEKMMADHCPLGRCALPEDVARVVAFLASGDGGWVNGTSHTFHISFTHTDKLQAKSSPSPVVHPSRATPVKI